VSRFTIETAPPRETLAPVRPRTARTAIVAFATLLLAALASAHADEPLATITGGRQDDGSYNWLVTNNYDKPIVFVEFPQFHGDLFKPPENWEQELSPLFAHDRGFCRASVRHPHDGILRNRTGTFWLRICADDAQTGHGDVLIRFADDRECIVPGVETPRPPKSSERLGGLAGFGLLIAAIVVIEVRRRRKARRAQAAPPADAPGS
jgi:hypothetical protein